MLDKTHICLLINLLITINFPNLLQKVVLNVFDVRTGRILREYKGGADDYATGGVGGAAGVSWPVFRCLWDFYFITHMLHTRVYLPRN